MLCGEQFGWQEKKRELVILERDGAGWNKPSVEEMGRYWTYLAHGAVELRGLAYRLGVNNKFPSLLGVCQGGPHFPYSWKSTPASNQGRLAAFLFAWTQSLEFFVPFCTFIFH